MSDDTPALFLTRVPQRPNDALDALAALIDEDEEGAAQPSHAPRRKRGLGDAQVRLALASCEDARDDDGRPVAGGVDNDDAVREREARAADMDRGRCVCAFAPARVGARCGVWSRPRAGGEEFSRKSVGSRASRTMS